jgi:hypothetical protein
MVPSELASKFELKFHRVPGNLTPEEDFSFEKNSMDINYENIIQSNQITEDIECLNLDLDFFEDYLQKEDKFFLLRKRKKRRFSLLMVFKLMRQNYRKQEIADKFGVSKTFITSLKVEIKKRLIKFGVHWTESKHRATKKRFLSDFELSKYVEELSKGNLNEK